MHTASRLLLASALALATLVARAGDSASSIAFSDPSKPGTLKIRVWHGDVIVHGADVKEISVKAEAQASSQPTPRKDGLRVLSASASYSLSEKNNVATLEYGSDGWSDGSSDFEITVPASTNIIVSNSVHGDVDCTGLSGDIEVKTTHGDVQLQDVSGGALVETVKGDVEVSLKSVAAGKPLSFSSMTGDVVIRAPADIKASVRFRTHRGTILTNFDDKSLVTKTEVSHRTHKAPVAPVPPGTPSADAKDAPAAPQSVGNDDDDSDEQWRAELRNSIRQAARDVAIAARDAAQAARAGMEEAKIEISTSMDAIPPLPPMTGGKTVSGTLNGGGVEIQAATLNGDITLKKIE